MPSSIDCTPPFADSSDSTTPGWMLIARRFGFSAARYSTSLDPAILEAEYADAPGNGGKVATDVDVFKRTGVDEATDKKDLVELKMPLILISKLVYQSLGSTETAEAGVFKYPALATRISISPKALLNCSNAA